MARSASCTEIPESSTVSETIKYSLKHKWIIKDFSLFFAGLPVGVSEPDYSSITSEPFHCQQDKRFEFKLQVYPRGRNQESKDGISLFLQTIFLKETVKVTIKFKVSILNERNEKSKSLSKLQLKFNLI